MTDAEIYKLLNSMKQDIYKYIEKIGGFYDLVYSESTKGIKKNSTTSDTLKTQLQTTQEAIDFLMSSAVSDSTDVDATPDEDTSTENSTAATTDTNNATNATNVTETK